ncbi:MAG TPA: hypothetical protein VKN14_11730 [Flavobacteriaceae bacterium]|nr:hypothetical protein [Flavobacteriaceae bacterium]
MKPVITFLCLLLSAIGFTQEKNIETQSVSIENLIPFIAENYSKNTNSLQNITFLIQTGSAGISNDDKVILKQAFKLLSKRLTEDDVISIITYAGLNGVALKQKSAKEIKAILHTINDFKSNIKEFHNDGLELAYVYAEENFNEEAINTIIMVRNPNIMANQSQYNSSAQTLSETKKPKNNAVILTAITLLPEIISIIKD